MSTVYLGLGSNIGDRNDHIQQAIRELEKNNNKIIACSSIIETNPVDCPGNQDNFLNAVIKIYTESSPSKLLETILRIEKDLGRTRPFNNAPRTIDIDILLFDNLKIKTATLEIPHPRILSRDFVINPLLEIEPDIIKKINNLDI